MLSNSIILEAKNISKSYGDFLVLDNISLSIKKGEIVAILGKSGSGKSTLMHIISSLDNADKGTIKINNKDLKSLSNKELSVVRNKEIGFVFQFHNLLPEFSAIENILLPGIIQGLPYDKTYKKALSLMNLLNIKDRKDYVPSQMSGGEQQRTAIARALINDPSIIFADEPSGNLDDQNTHQFYHLICRLNQEFNQTFMIVTHDRILTNKASRILYIRNKKLTSTEENCES